MSFIGFDMARRTWDGPPPLIRFSSGPHTFAFRHRPGVAVARAGTTGHGGPRVQAIVPLPLAGAMRALLNGGEPVELTVDRDRVTLAAGDRQTAGQCLDHDFPDYCRLVRLPAGRRALVGCRRLRGRWRGARAHRQRTGAEATAAGTGAGPRTVHGVSAPSSRGGGRSPTKPSGW